MKIKNYLLNFGRTLILPVACWAIFAAITKGRFATLNSIMSVLRTCVVPILVAMSMSFGMNMGMLNFAAGSVVITSGIFAANIAKSLGWGLPGICVLCVVFSLAICAINGGLYRMMRVPCLVLSLGFCMIIEALPVLFFPSGTGSIKLTQAILASSPWCFIILGVALLLFYYITSCTSFGSNMKAIGANIQIANSAGINIDKVKFLSFLLSGLFLGITTIMYLSSTVMLTGNVGFSSVALIIDGFMGVFVANVYSKYVNYCISLVLGTITVRILGSGLVACGLSSEARGVLTGLFLLVVLTYSANSGLPAQLRSEKKVRDKAIATLKVNN